MIRAACWSPGEGGGGGATGTQTRSDWQDECSFRFVCDNYDSSSLLVSRRGGGGRQAHRQGQTGKTSAHFVCDNYDSSGIDRTVRPRQLDFLSLGPL